MKFDKAFCGTSWQSRLKSTEVQNENSKTLFSPINGSL